MLLFIFGHNRTNNQKTIEVESYATQVVMRQHHIVMIGFDLLMVGQIYIILLLNKK